MGRWKPLYFSLLVCIMRGAAGVALTVKIIDRQNAPGRIQNRDSLADPVLNRALVTGGRR